MSDQFQPMPIRSNFFFYSNSLWDDGILACLTEAEHRVLHGIFRKTVGYHKNWDRISISQFMDGTGMSKNSVKAGIRGLLDKNLILRKDTDNGYIYCLKVTGEKHHFEPVNLVKKNGQSYNKKITQGQSLTPPVVSVVTSESDQEGQPLTPQNKVFNTLINNTKETQVDETDLGWFEDLLDYLRLEEEGSEIIYDESDPEIDASQARKRAKWEIPDTTFQKYVLKICRRKWFKTMEKRKVIAIEKSMLPQMPGKTQRFPKEWIDHCIEWAQEKNKTRTVIVFGNLLTAFYNSDAKTDWIAKHLKSDTREMNYDVPNQIVERRK